MLCRFRFALHKSFVDGHIRGDIRQFSSLPGFYLPARRVEITLQCLNARFGSSVAFGVFKSDFDGLDCFRGSSCEAPTFDGVCGSIQQNGMATDWVHILDMAVGPDCDLEAYLTAELHATGDLRIRRHNSGLYLARCAVFLATNASWLKQKEQGGKDRKREGPFRPEREHVKLL
jgi:hypothetical protein